MRIALAMISLLFFTSASEIHQDFVDSSDTALEEEQSANHSYGIPVGTWKITDLTTTEKDMVCSEQKNFCSNKCGGEGLVLKNFCNTSTMAWNCQCKNHVPDTPPYGWPSTIAECQGKETTCKNRCSYGTTNALCLSACNQYYKCNQAGSPASGLQVDNEYDTPNYNVVITENEDTFHSPLKPSIAAQLHVSSFIQIVIAAAVSVVVI